MGTISNFMTERKIASLIGERLRNKRLEREMSIEDVALHCGLSRKTVAACEAGENIGFHSFLKVLYGLNILGALNASFPDTLVNPNTFTKKETVRKRAYKPRKKVNT